MVMFHFRKTKKTKGLAVRSWCCPREPAQAGGADCAWWPGAFALLGEGAISW